MAKAKKSDDNQELIIKSIEKIFSLIGVSANFKVDFDSENKLYLVNVDAGDEAGLLIGKKGETINAIQTLVNQIIRQKKNEWVRVVVNIADFREKEKSRMEELAQQTAARVKGTGESQNLYNLTPSQRRVVHMTLANEEGIKTESVGEGSERYLVVSKKS